MTSLHFILVAIALAIPFGFFMRWLDKRVQKGIERVAKRWFDTGGDQL